MTRNRLAACLAPALFGAALAAGCETAPVTERSQFIIVSPEQAAEMGAQAYQQIRQEMPISQDPGLNEVVRRVGQRVVQAAETPNEGWEFTVFEDSSPNAFALPGGKIGVNTGMFKVAQNEDQLAAVIAHEIAHVVARHSAERMSQQMAIQGGLTAAGMASQSLGQYADLLAKAATLGVVLPFSREQEAEADEIGLMYMARAGYDPRAAIELWQNMSGAGGEGPPEFLSTHPAPGSRIERLQALMPRAMEVYRSRTG